MAIFSSYVSLPEGKHGCFPQLDDQRVPVRRHALDALDNVSGVPIETGILWILMLRL